MIDKPYLLLYTDSMGNPIPVNAVIEVDSNEQDVIQPDKFIEAVNTHAPETWRTCTVITNTSVVNTFYNNECDENVVFERVTKTFTDWDTAEGEDNIGWQIADFVSYTLTTYEKENDMSFSGKPMTISALGYIDIDNDDIHVVIRIMEGFAIEILINMRESMEDKDDIVADIADKVSLKLNKRHYKENKYEINGKETC